MMIKKILFFIIVCAIFAIPAVGAESGPSNTVGFFTWNCPPGTWVPFSFPFTYYIENHVLTYNINDIIVGDFTPGDYLTGDRIIDQNTGAIDYLDITSNQWVGGFSQIVPGHAYWAYVQHNHPAVSAVTAGEVDMTEVNLGTMNSGQFTPVGVRDPGVVLLANACLLSSGFTGEDYFTSDRIIDQNTGAFAIYSLASSNWVGAMTSLQPNHAYWIYVPANHNPFEWVYTAAGIPNPGPNPGALKPGSSNPTNQALRHNARKVILNQKTTN
jgi:hypothetical protein